MLNILTILSNKIMGNHPQLAYHPFAAIAVYATTTAISITE